MAVLVLHPREHRAVRIRLNLDPCRVAERLVARKITDAGQRRKRRLSSGERLRRHRAVLPNRVRGERQILLRATDKNFRAVVPPSSSGA